MSEIVMSEETKLLTKLNGKHLYRRSINISKGINEGIYKFNIENIDEILFDNNCTYFFTPSEKVEEEPEEVDHSVGTVLKTKISSYIWAKPDLTGNPVLCPAKTEVEVKENTSENVDLVLVKSTGKVGYISTIAYTFASLDDVSVYDYGTTRFFKTSNDNDLEIADYKYGVILSLTKSHFTIRTNKSDIAETLKVSIFYTKTTDEVENSEVIEE